MAKPDLLLLAPGPINRGVELTPEVADGTHSAILDQVTNGLAVRMAVLYLLSGKIGRAGPRTPDRRPTIEPTGTVPSAMGKLALPTIQIAGGRIIDPSQDIDQIGDLWISRGRVLPIGRRATRRPRS